MNREEIIQELQSNYKEFITTISTLSEEQFNFHKEGKWSAGQTLDHLYRALSTLSMAMQLPKVVFSVLFSKANRPSKSYDELVAKYKRKLDEGGKASGRYLSAKISFVNQQKTEAALQKSVNNLCKNLGSYSEEQLDTYILPHPLLGKITIREMMYFSIYHSQHHKQGVLRALNA
jgi:uncharacterized damage-inducible protein DinB